ncbi:methyltransferase [Mycobacterium vulneris]|jgi:FkbM family methyltransferase|uniref:Methyltransferase n=1 Tax=Mycolicibacterium vulneris TaxID=547163 RepID=A0A1X2L4A3_9MYCO|nr:FkbM family methyltransferase [Mycolicibacterium vulneris]OSC28840.1 methyltransferase [Mycolicibacterium vulneris]
MPATRSAKRWLAPAAKTLAPRLFWGRKYRILRRLGESRPDVRLAASLCDPARISLDIGADVGEFTIAMLGSSLSVIAFEPRPAQARDLASMLKAVGAAARVEAVALSDKRGTTSMRVVASEPGRSTIDSKNALSDVNGSEVQSIDVPVTRLDDLHLDDIGMIKIDVEGHELAVLRGASKTLVRNRPVVLLEAEERHRTDAVAEINQFLNGLGFSGYFDRGDAWLPIEEFDPAQHQNPANLGNRVNDWAPRGVYVNSFSFFPKMVEQQVK